jgi:hypothetical protein
MRPEHISILVDVCTSRDPGQDRDQYFHQARLHLRVAQSASPSPAYANAQM